MSLVRQALGLEQRAVLTLDSLGPTVTHMGGDPLSGQIPHGYGTMGAGYWDTGMVWRDGGGASTTYAATPESAMRLSAVFGCQRVLSEPIATLPLDVFERTGDTRTPVVPPGYLTFGWPSMARTEYLGSLMLSLLNDGNAFVGTPRSPIGEPTALIPLDPRRVTVERYPKGHPRQGLVFYRIDSDRTELGPLDIMHIKGMTFPGALRGISPIAMAREVIGAAGDAQTYGANMFRNGAVPAAVLEVPSGTGMPDEERARAALIGQTWNETNGGVSRAGQVGVLMGGAKLTTVALSAEDAQWLDSRRFGVQEIARFYGVPPHLIADASNSTSWGSGLAEQNLAYGQLSLSPWLVRLEEGHDRLLYSDGRGDLRTRLNLDARLRASPEDRWAVYAVALACKAMTINEVRALEDLPPVPWGDEPIDIEMPAPRPKPALTPPGGPTA